MKNLRSAAWIFSLALIFSSSLRAQEQKPPPPKPVQEVDLKAEAPARPPLTPRQAEEMRADLLMVRKQYSDAIQAYERLLQTEARNAVLMNKIGIAFHQLLELDKARRYYERAIKADKAYAQAHNNLGTVWYHRKNYRRAINAYKKATTLNPELAPVQSNLGYAYFARKQYDQALLSFQRALELDPEIFERRSSAGTLLQDRSVADRGFFYFFLAKSFAQVGNAERCAHYLRRSKDEGYKDWASALKDPAFGNVVNDPQVQEVLHPPTPIAAVKP